MEPVLRRIGIVRTQADCWPLSGVAIDSFGRPLNATNAPIVSAGGRRVGDYTVSILLPWAAEVVKKHAETELNAGPAPRGTKCPSLTRE